MSQTPMGQTGTSKTPLPGMVEATTAEKGTRVSTRSPTRRRIHAPTTRSVRIRSAFKEPMAYRDALNPLENRRVMAVISMAAANRMPIATTESAWPLRICIVEVLLLPAWTSVGPTSAAPTMLVQGTRPVCPEASGAGSEIAARQALVGHTRTAMREVPARSIRMAAAAPRSTFAPIHRILAFVEVIAAESISRSAYPRMTVRGHAASAIHQGRSSA